jgi:hypothetical protein
MNIVCGEALLNDLTVGVRKGLQGFCRVILEYGTAVVINRVGLILYAFNISSVGVLMVLVALADWDTLPASILCHKLLQTIRQPYVEKGDEGHHSEPMGGIVYTSSAVVSMTSEQRPYTYTPFKSFHRGIIPEHIFKSQRVIPSWLFSCIIIKKILLWRLKFPDIGASKFVDFCHFLWLLIGPAVKTLRWVFCSRHLRLFVFHFKFN